MEMDEKQIQGEEIPVKKCRIAALFGLHNQVRVVSVVLAVLAAIILSASLHHQLELYPLQNACLYASVGCLAFLLIGAFVTIPVLYVPAVYIMRLAIISVIVSNTMLIVETANGLDTFVEETKLRSKSSTIYYLNRNFKLLSHCLNLSVQAWICLLIFGCLQLVSKDYYRLRSAKTSRGFYFGRRIRRFVTLDSLRFSRPKTPVFEMDPTGKVVEAKIDEFGHESSAPETVLVIQSQEPVIKKAEDQQKQFNLSPNQQPPQVQPQRKLSAHQHPFQALQDQITKFTRSQESTQPKNVPDQQMEPMKTQNGETTEHQEQPKSDKSQFHYETFAC